MNTFSQGNNELPAVKAPGQKNIYKKSLAIELIKRGHDLKWTMRNKYNSKYQVFVFAETPALIADLLNINKDMEKLLS